MEFQKARLFFERDYTIDYNSRTITIEHPKTFLPYLFDFFIDWWYKTVQWFIATALLCFVVVFVLKFFIFIEPKTFTQWMRNIFSFYCLFFFIFNIYYMFTNHKLAVQLQMFFEEVGVNSWFSKWKEEVINVNSQTITIPFKVYVKYHMLFYGECKNQLDRIEYRILKDDTFTEKLFFGRGRILTIFFKQPTTGTIVLRYRGALNY